MSSKEMAQKLADDEVVKSFDLLAHRVTGLRLIILLPGENRALEISQPSGENVMPGFCRMMRSTVEGQRRCSTCRSLVAFAAANRGGIEHTCHGGVYVMAAPAAVPGKAPIESPVVSTCAYRMAHDGLSWQKAQSHLAGIPVDRRKMKAEYENMPQLTRRQRDLAREILDLAAWGIGQKYSSLEKKNETTTPAARSSMETMESQFHSALRLVGEGELERGNQSPGKTLVEMVAGVVMREPALPHSVSLIARAARMTPNHFSTLFRRHMGKTFMEFLIEKRIEMAKKQLSNLTLGIHEVAVQSGFPDANYFARVFKKHTGMTPREWREKWS
ncbi:MAG TPA: hypothetical protein DCZ95_10085 [Verrucomicrobia bacterium]|nr:MAG: hypothetical protein A2X46_00305 [Lentisphaerae bacterium GWF2_57_35]HBA84430.1 hypothetical protein [Verrucomicrobiota bacterium]